MTICVKTSEFEPEPTFHDLLTSSDLQGHPILIFYASFQSWDLNKKNKTYFDTVALQLSKIWQIEFPLPQIYMFQKGATHVENMTLQTLCNPILLDKASFLVSQTPTNMIQGLKILGQGCHFKIAFLHLFMVWVLD